MGTAATLWGLGSVFWLAGADAGSVAVSVAWTAAAVFSGIGLAQFPGTTPLASGRLRTVVDALIVGASTLMIAWPLGFGDLYHTGGEAQLTVVPALAFI